MLALHPRITSTTPLSLMGRWLCDTRLPVLCLFGEKSRKALSRSIAYRNYFNEILAKYIPQDDASPKPLPLHEVNLCIASKLTISYHATMFTLRYHKQAMKVLIKMPRDVAKKIRDELCLIAQNPSSYTGDWKPLAGVPFWRLRVGGWRAICEIRDNELILFVLKIGARGDVYK